MPREDGDSEPIHVVYLGPEASFSHQAALAVFPPSSSASLHPVPSFTAIFEALQSPSESGPSYNYAVIPVENSADGSVVEVLDLLAKCSDTQYSDLEVCAEHYLPVHHCLFTSYSPTSNGTTTSATSKTSFSTITTLYTHPKVWGQCARFLSRHFSPSTTERIDVSSTSAAARLVAQDPSGRSAAIASSFAGALHKLQPLATNIEDEPERNTTRFFVVRKRKRRGTDVLPLSVQTQPQPQSADEAKNPAQAQNIKSLLTFSIPHHQPGSLADTLAVFKDFKFNLTSIDTRPSRRRNWQYVLFVECEEMRVPREPGESGEDNIRALVKELREGGLTERVRWLGSWRDVLRS